MKTKILTGIILILTLIILILIIKLNNKSLNNVVQKDNIVTTNINSNNLDYKKLFENVYNGRKSEIESQLYGTNWKFKDFTIADGGEGYNKQINGTIKFLGKSSFELNICGINTGTYDYPENEYGNTIILKNINKDGSCDEEKQFLSDFSKNGFEVTFNGTSLKLNNPSGVSGYDLVPKI